MLESSFIAILTVATLLKNCAFVSADVRRISGTLTESMYIYPTTKFFIVTSSCLTLPPMI